MDETSFVEQLRADAARIDAATNYHTRDTDVDVLVAGALREGRRRRTRRRVAGAVTGTLTATLVVATVAVAYPLAQHDNHQSIAASPASPAPPPTPSPPDRSTPSPSVTIARPRATAGRVHGSPADVRGALVALLPDTFTVTRSSTERAEGSDGFDWENTASVTLRDAKGTSYVFAGIGNDTYTDGCFGLADCTKTALPGGGTLWVTSSPSGDKSGADRSFRYNRPDGTHVWLDERTYPSGNGPSTRSAVPLNDRAGREFVASPAWDKLFTQ